MKVSLCLSVLLLFLLAVSIAGQVKAQSNYLEESVSINVNCQTGTVDVSSEEDYTPVNNTTPLHTPAGMNLTNMNSTDARDVTLTFSAQNSTISVWVNNVAQNRTIGDAWATMLSTSFQTSFVYDYTSMFGDFVNYKASGKSNLVQFMQSLMSWCFASDLNGLSPTFTQIAGKPNAYITVDTFYGSYGWYFSVKCSYETSMPTGPGDHTIDVLSLLGVNSLAPSNYSGYYDDNYLTTVYLSGVDISLTSSGTVTYSTSQPAGLSTNRPAPGVLQTRGWYDYYGSGTSPSFRFENDSSPATQLTYTFNGTVVPEFQYMMSLLLLIVFATAAILGTRRIHRDTQNKNCARLNAP